MYTVHMRELLNRFCFLPFLSCRYWCTAATLQDTDKRKAPGWWVISSRSRALILHTDPDTQQQQTSLRVVASRRPHTEKDYFLFIYLKNSFLLLPFCRAIYQSATKASQRERREKERKRNHNDRSTVSSEFPLKSFFFFKYYFIFFFFYLLGSPSSVDWQNPPVLSVLVFFISFSFHECAQSKQKAEEEKKKTQERDATRVAHPIDST